MTRIDKEVLPGGAASAPIGKLSITSRLKPEHIALLLILLAGFILRYVDIGVGLPYQYNWDQPEITGPALRLLRDGEYQPERFAYGPLNQYLQAAWGVLTYVRGLENGSFPDGIYGIKTNRDTGWYWSVTSPFFEREARLLTVFYGCIMVLALYGAGRTLGGTLVGLWAAAFGAFSTWCRLTSTSVSADASSGCCIAITLWASCEILRSRARWAYVTATILSGMAIAFKYPAFPVILFPLLAHVLSTDGRTRKIADVRLVGIFIGIVLSVALFAFPIFLNPTTFLHDLSSEVSFYGSTKDIGYGGAASGFLRGLLVSFDVATAGDWIRVRGILIILSVLAGVIILWRKKWRTFLFLILPAVSNIKFVSSHPGKFYERNFILSTVAMAPLGGFIWQALKDRDWCWRNINLKELLPRNTWYVVPALCFLPLFLVQVRDARTSMNLIDSRLLMSQKLMKDLPKGSKILIADEVRWFDTFEEKEYFQIKHGPILRLLNNPPMTSDTQYLLVPQQMSEFNESTDVRRDLVARINGFLKRLKPIAGYQFGATATGYDRPLINPAVCLVHNDDRIWRYSAKQDNQIFGLELDAGPRNEALHLTKFGIGVPPKVSVEAPVRVSTTSTMMMLKARGMCRFVQPEAPTIRYDIFKASEPKEPKPVSSGDIYLGRTHTGLMEYDRSVKIPKGEYVVRLSSKDPDNYMAEIELLSFK